MSGMNRTDRLYAIVEELRAVSPRPRSAAWLAGRFEVSTRTVERDIASLQQASVPIWARPGRDGGYCLERAVTLPPVNFTAAEAVAVSLSLASLKATPFSEAGRAALLKLTAAMRQADSRGAEELSRRVFILDGPHRGVPDAPQNNELADAVTAGRVLHLTYRDRDDSLTVRDVEPLGLIGAASGWYLVAWCRLRDGLRTFKISRIEAVEPSQEKAPRRRLSLSDVQVPEGDLRSFTLL